MNTYAIKCYPWEFKPLLLPSLPMPTTKRHTKSSGLLQQIRVAKTADEVTVLSETARNFKRASDGTRRRWTRASLQRLAELRRAA